MLDHVKAREAITRLEGKKETLQHERRLLMERLGVDPDDGDAREKLADVTRGLNVTESELVNANSDWQKAMQRGLEAGLFGTETIGEETAPTRDLAGPPHVRQARELGLRAVERHKHELAPAAGDRLDRLIRSGDPTGATGRYLAAVASPDYESAFWTMLQHPTDAHLRFSAAEVEAVRAVSRAAQERAMSIGGSAGADGGFLVPFTLDPTIAPAGDGTQNPIRQVARVVTIASNEWRGVSSEGITAAFEAELTEVGESVPTLVQPTVTVHKAQCFIPFSIELDQDASGLRQSLAAMLLDAKDNLESTKYLLGAGDASDEPEGLLVGATEIVPTASGTTLATGDVYQLLQTIPPRYQQRTSVLASQGIFDFLYQAVGGNSTEPPVLPTREGPILGRPKYEWSEMDATTQAGDTVAVAGDFAAGFVICDRVGLSIELVPHVFGQNRRPIGARGVYAYWRTGSAVVLPNALRQLIMATP